MALSTRIFITCFATVLLFYSHTADAAVSVDWGDLHREFVQTSDSSSFIKVLQTKPVAALQDTTPVTAHPDSVPYSAEPTFGRQLLKAPAAIFHAATLPLKWSIIFINEKQILSKLSNFFLNDEGTAGFYPNFSVGGRTDFAAGITYFNRDVFDAGHSLDMNAFYTNGTNFTLGATYKIPPDESRQYQISATGDVRRNDDQDIFVGGNDASEDLEIDYAIERYKFQAEFGYLPQQNLLASFNTGINHTVINNISPFTETGVPVQGLIDPEPFGVGINTLVNAGFSATLDLRKAGSQNKNTNLVSTVTSSYDFKQTKTRIYSGALFDAGLTYNRSLNNTNFEFLNYYGDWQQFFPVPGLPANRRLAFRARLEKRYPLGDAAVPFYEQSFLGDADNLRGYEQDRFRNLGPCCLHSNIAIPSGIPGMR